MSNDALQADLSEKNSLLLRLKKEKDTQLSKTVSLVVYEDMKKECECLSSVNLQQKVSTYLIILSFYLLSIYLITFPVPKFSLKLSSLFFLRKFLI